MHVYVFHCRLFGSPRIITSNFPLDRYLLDAMVNGDNNYDSESRWKLVEIPIYPNVEIEPCGK